jgi:hypothetical protein
VSVYTSDHAYYDDDEDYDDVPDAQEWQPDQGECDNCSGGDANGVTVPNGPLGPLYCACKIGQGATEEECVCG